MLCRLQHAITDSVNSGVYRTEVGKMDLFAWVRVLVFLQRDQSLTPVRVAVGEQVVTLRLIDQWCEVGHVVGSETQAVCRIQHNQRDKGKSRRAMLTKAVPSGG